ncbi:putative protein N(5)-glutamine methyltransferase [Microlunatus soli]|uniref:peptide chain release factor N(5)-glutamine methyltransferase n=1 Tax=Microlunatus soli TaxID=630515 RepID=A0A1H2AL46_9ACTN|nr:putative protein N(5)-glutamine methyltransferase [Microlunatus soli]SDT46683.1 release factor glutamine methyltransferase [Microlunatus soli]
MNHTDPNTGSDPVVDRLRAAGCVFAEDEAALLRNEAVDAAALQQMIERRIAGVPLEQIVGWAEFCGQRFAVEPGVFVPRRRTELLVRTAADRCGSGSVLVDLCGGVGAVASAVLTSVGSLELYCTEIDPVAVSCARRNLAARASVLHGDLFDPLPQALRGSVAMITANAPYVPTGEIAFMPAEARDHELLAALDGGADGLDIHRRIIEQAPEWLTDGGWLIIETGRGQADIDRELLAAAGFDASTIIDDEIDGTVVAGQLSRHRGAHR